MRTTGCPGETFKSHCQVWPSEHIPLPQLQGEWPHRDPATVHCNLKLSSSIEKTPQHGRPFFYGGSSPMRGPPLGTQKVCTVPSLPTIWGHGGGENKVTFQRFLVQQRKADVVISWAYRSCTSLLSEPAFAPWCPLLSSVSNSSSRAHLSSGCHPPSYSSWPFA